MSSALQVCIALTAGQLAELDAKVEQARARGRWLSRSELIRRAVDAFDPTTLPVDPPAPVRDRTIEWRERYEAALERHRAFAAVWNACASVTEVCQRLVLPRATARQRADRARDAGLELRPLTWQHAITCACGVAFTSLSTTKPPTMCRACARRR